MLKKVRIDKYLWAIRIFKSRSMSTNACKSGKVKIDEESMKPSHFLKGGEILTVKKGPIKYTLKVLELIDKRMSASLVADKYEDMTPEKDKLIHKVASVFHSNAYREKGKGRPTKKERRDMDKRDQGDSDW